MWTYPSRAHARLALALATLTGCADTIAPDRPDAPPAADDARPPGRLHTTRAADGSYTTTVDATAADAWVHAELQTGTEVDATGAWDLRFQRFHISTNGGVSGTGGVAIAPLPGLTFAEATTAPTAGWISDAPDDADPDALPEYAFEQDAGWFAYDPATHVLTPRPLVWAVRTTDGALRKLEITRYYDAAGTAGWFTFHWASL